MPAKQSKPPKDPNRQGRLRWSPRKEDAFITELAESANIVRAARLTGFSKATAYNWRRADADFAARWDEARAQGLDRLETALLHRALTVAERGGAEEELAMVPVTFKDALALINRNAAIQLRTNVRSIAEDAQAARAEILKAVLAIKRAHEKATAEPTEPHE